VCFSVVVDVVGVVSITKTTQCNCTYANFCAFTNHVGLAQNRFNVCFVR